MPSKTAVHLPAKQRTNDSAVPSLHAGDHLTRAEFERRYRAAPHIKKAELIEGVVFVPSPVFMGKHARPHLHIAGLLANYIAATPGTDGGDNATVRLDAENVVQPDALLRLDEKHGGQSRETADDYLQGAPELVIEIAASSASYDLHDKLRVYRRNGVQEYGVLLALEQQTVWYRLNEGRYDEVRPDADGIIRSQAFPGLWFHSDSLWADDLSGLLAALQTGLASPEHAAFVASLTAAP